MAEKIIALLRYKALSKTLSEAEFKAASSMTWDKVAEETIRVYEEVSRKEV